MLVDKALNAHMLPPSLLSLPQLPSLLPLTLDGGFITLCYITIHLASFMYIFRYRLLVRLQYTVCVCIISCEVTVFVPCLSALQPERVDKTIYT